MLTRHKHGLRSIRLVLLAAGLAFAAPSPSPAPLKPFSVYHDGDRIVFTPETTGTRRMAKVGPWVLGERLQDGKPMDKHLNLYLVLPGTQYRSPEHPEYDHTRIINKYTVDGEVRDWDIYYCFIIDPKLADNFHRESELLVAAHQTFGPAGLRLSDVPSNEIMRKELGVKSMAGLRKYHRKGHTLPRLLIVPAHLAVRATAELPDVIITHPGAQPPSVH